MNKVGRNAFLLDGIGALTSAASCGILLPFFSPWTGLTTKSLYVLAGISFFYGLYSVSCYAFSKRITSTMLLAIVIGNIFYCTLTTLLILFLPRITSLGRLLLAAEIFVILLIVAVELSAYRTLNSKSARPCLRNSASEVAKIFPKSQRSRKHISHNSKTHFLEFGEL